LCVHPQVRLDQGSAEACVSRFRALQAEDAGLGLQDLNIFITVSPQHCHLLLLLLLLLLL
jgi:hypothetical protein